MDEHMTIPESGYTIRGQVVVDGVDRYVTIALPADGVPGTLAASSQPTTGVPLLPEIVTYLRSALRDALLAE